MVQISKFLVIFWIFSLEIVIMSFFKKGDFWDLTKGDPASPVMHLTKPHHPFPWDRPFFTFLVQGRCVTFTKYFSPLKATGHFDLDLGIYLDQRFYLAIKLYCALYLLDNYGLFTKYPVKRIYCCLYSFNMYFVDQKVSNLPVL